MKDCHVSCDANGKIVRGKPECPDTPWTECSDSCSQYRTVSNDACKSSAQTRQCSSGACPLNEGDFIILLDLKVTILPKMWSYVYSEAFIQALESIFQVPAGSIDLLNDASQEFNKEVRLHFEIHLQAKAFKSSIEFRQAAEIIPSMANSYSFPRLLLSKLNEISNSNDKVHSHLRYELAVYSYL
jgi:hypothetical protein